MPDFTGTVRILNSDSGQTTIELEGGDDERGGNIALGGNGQDGDLTILDSQGRQRIFLNGRQGQARFELENGNTSIFIDGQRGNISLTGDITLTNADCAEDFDISVGSEMIEPGTVMVLGEGEKLQQSQIAYDKRVAGVISGAGNYKPGLILDKQESSSNLRLPIALMGKVYCKVDASYGAIEVGDLLTTSPTPGHAMKADNPLKAFGTVIGKALRPLAEGQGLIPVLVALQ